MTKVSTTESPFRWQGGRVGGEPTGGGGVHRTLRRARCHDRDLRHRRRVRARTGGPKDDGPKILEHVVGWTFVVVLAMLVTQLGLL